MLPNTIATTLILGVEPTFVGSEEVVAESVENGVGVDSVVVWMFEVVNDTDVVSELDVVSDPVVEVVSADAVNESDVVDVVESETDVDEIDVVNELVVDIADDVVDVVDIIEDVVDVSLVSFVLVTQTKFVQFSLLLHWSEDVHFRTVTHFWLSQIWELELQHNTPHIKNVFAHWQE